MSGDRTPEGWAAVAAVDVLTPVATVVPAARPPPVIATSVPVDSATVTRTGCSLPSTTCHSRAFEPGVPAAGRAWPVPARAVRWPRGADPAAAADAAPLEVAPVARARVAACGSSWPSAANRSASGLKRIAAIGTFRASSTRAVSMLTVAVMPGFSFAPGFGTVIIVVGVGIFGTLTGYLANLFLSPSAKEKAPPTDLELKLQELKELAARQQSAIDELEGLIDRK